MDDEITKCSVCGDPVRYGSRHSQCGAAIEEAIKAEREACAKACEALWQEEATAAANGNQNPRYHDCIECAHAIRERSNV